MVSLAFDANFTTQLKGESHTRGFEKKQNNQSDAESWQNVGRETVPDWQNASTILPV